MIIELKAKDFINAATNASVFILSSIKKQRNTDHGGNSQRKMSSRIADWFIGELGEIAVSRFTGLAKMSTLEVTNTADIGKTIEVRTTEHANGHLILYKNSNDNYNFVFVTINGLQANLVGWINPKDGKKPEYFRSADPDCYFVPQSALNPIETLPIK